METTTKFSVAVLGPTAILLGLVAVHLLGGRARAPTEASPRTVLRIAFGPDDGSRGLVVYRLTCGPASGTVPAPGAVCAWLTRHSAATAAKSSDIACSATVGAWAAAVSGRVGQTPVSAEFGSCSRLVEVWMRLTGYRPCPRSFIVFNCRRGPYAFGKAHARGIHTVVPKVVGLPIRLADLALRKRGLIPVVSRKPERVRCDVVRTQDPRAGGSVNVYASVTLGTGCAPAQPGVVSSGP